jgi:hypothetical protein
MPLIVLSSPSEFLMPKADWLLAIAKSWLALAEQAVKNSETALARHCSLLQPLMRDQPQPACDRLENNSAERASAYHYDPQY